MNFQESELMLKRIRIEQNKPLTSIKKQRKIWMIICFPYQSMSMPFNI